MQINTQRVMNLIQPLDNDNVGHKFAFVILHYCAKEDTIECVESIESKISNAGYEIVIVDNASPDGSGRFLQNLYAKKNNVSIILSEHNLGFAKGNNLGFEFAKNQKGCDFIVMINNDTIILQNNFLDIITEEYKKSSFAVLGPKIITRSEPYDDNPGRASIMTISEINKYIWKVRIHLILNYLGTEEVFNSALDLIKSVLKPKSSTNSKRSDARCEDVQLHGSCLIFSPIYVNKYDGLDNRTFLYKEEEILFTQMRKDHQKTVYNPQLEIFHKEDASTNAIIQKPNKKRRFIYKHLIKSAKVLKTVVEE